jgi:sec-independent protein translocase protein TatB
MFDIGASELLVILIVAILVIGPKDMPLAMRTAGRWIGKIRRVSAHFRAGIDTMVREAELEEMEKKWKARNEEIMRRTAATSEASEADIEDGHEMHGPPPVNIPVAPSFDTPTDTPADHGIDLPGIPDPTADDPAPLILPAKVHDSSLKLDE